LSATELAVCGAMGLNPDDYRKTARTCLIFDDPNSRRTVWPH
jgi:hypothetical protein